VEGKPDTTLLDLAGLSEDMVKDMYQIMAIANYEDRYVIPTGHKEETLDAFGESGGCGFTFGNGCSGHSNSKTDLFEATRASRGRSGSQKDNRVNTIFTGQLNIKRSGGGCSTGGCGSGGGCGGGKKSCGD
jgi:nitrate reductase beta subunit